MLDITNSVNSSLKIQHSLHPQIGLWHEGISNSRSKMLFDPLMDCKYNLLCLSSDSRLIKRHPEQPVTLREKNQLSIPHRDQYSEKISSYTRHKKREKKMNQK